MAQRYATELISEEMALFSTSEVPRKLEGAYTVTVTAEQPFKVVLNGRVTQYAKSLEVRHPKPLTIEGIRGMNKISYLAPRNAHSPESIAQEVMLDAGRGSLQIAGYEKLPESELLSSKTTVGSVTIPRFRDPRYVRIDGREHLNLDYVEVNNLKGTVKISLRQSAQ